MGGVSPLVRDALAWRRYHQRALGHVREYPAVALYRVRAAEPGERAELPHRLGLAAYLPDPLLPLPEGGSRWP